MKKEKKELLDFQTFSDSLLKSFQKAQKKICIPSKNKIFKGKDKIKESAVLLLSDIHVGKINYFPDEVGKSIQTYNERIMWMNANRLVESIAQVNYLLSSYYKLKKLYIFGLGDIIDNDVIVQGQQLFIDVGAGAQLMKAVNLLTQIITQLLTQFEEIELNIIGGNHGRINAKARDMIPFYNNLDYLLGKILQIQFKDEKRVKVICPESWFHIVTIKGWKYFIHHGNTTKSWLGLPYYGITRKSMARRGEMHYDIECIGHFHHRMNINIGSRSRTIVNGCWIENDDFSWKNYGTFTYPQQYYFGVSKKRPKTWSWDLDLVPTR
jgi:hypothetical protein